MSVDSRPKEFSKLFRQQLGLLGFVAVILIYTFPLRAERLPVKTYTVADGLLRDDVHKIKQDSRGFLWFCTQEGISRFDGYAFTNFTTDDGLPDRHVNDFLETRGGEIFIATDSGLAKLNPTGVHDSNDNSLFKVYLPDNARAKAINVLFEDENGRVLGGTSDGLYRLKENGEFEKVDLGKSTPEVDALFVTSIIKDRRGAMWIGTNSGLYRIAVNDKVEHFAKEDGLPDINISVLHEDRNGRIWIGFRPNNVVGLVLLVADPQKSQNVVERIYGEKEGLPIGWVTDLFEASDGKFWVGTTRGLCEWQGGADSVCKTYTTKNDLCDQDVTAIIEDKDKNLWLGTQCGLKKWARYGFTAYAEDNGTSAPNANSIFENATGELYVSFSDGRIRTVTRFDGEQFDFVKPNFPPEITYFGWGWKQTVWQDRAGDWWFPTGYGLYRFPQTARVEDLARMSPQKLSFGARNNEIFRFYEDSHGDFWIATTGLTNELWHWQRENDDWRNLSLDTGISKTRFGTAFAEDQSGNLWIGTGSDTGDTALIRYRDGQFKVFTQAENKLLVGWMRDLYIDRTGRLWIADTITGALRLDDVNADRLDFKRYTPSEGLSSVGILCITEDEFGRIYMGTGRGLDRLNPETGQVENFTTADGLPNSHIEIAYRDRKNNLWFGTANGLARLVPEPERNRQPPNVLITALRINGESQSVSVLGEREIPTLELDSDRRQITIDFLGLGSNLGEKLKYDYRLGESEWTPTMERTVNFANLASGEYHFEVRTQTADRIYSQTPAAFAFRIAAPIWQRWWFVLGIFILAGLAVYLFYKNRLARLLEMERMRMRIASDLHDDIGANLTKIAILSEVAQQQLGQNSGMHGKGKNNLLGSVAEISRESVSAMGDIVWAINPKKDSLIGLTRRMRQYAEEILERCDIRLEFEAPVVEPDLKLNANIRRNIYLIFKESVNNIVRHSNAAAVKIDFGLVGKELVLQVSDDGIGFDAMREYDGNGLSSIKKRAEDCDGHLEINSFEGAGTKIVLRLKLKSATWSWR